MTTMEGLFPIVMMIVIIAAGIEVIRQTKDHHVDNLINGFGTWLFQVLLMIGLYLGVKNNLTSQTVQLVLIISAIVVLSTGITLEIRSKA